MSCALGYVLLRSDQQEQLDEAVTSPLHLVQGRYCESIVLRKAEYVVTFLAAFLAAASSSVAFLAAASSA